MSRKKREPNDDAQFFQGGRGDGNEHKLGYGEKPKPVSLPENIQWDAMEVRLADGLRSIGFIGCIPPLEGGGCVQTSAEGSGRILFHDLASEFITGALVKQQIPFRVEPTELPSTQERKLFSVDAKALLGFLHRDDVQRVLEKARTHENNQKNKFSDSADTQHVSWPLSDRSRANLVILENLCKTALGNALPRRIGPGDRGERGGRKDHPGVGQHEPGGRE